MTADDRAVLAFLEPQIRDHGANHEVEPGTWILFAVAAGDTAANAVARELLDTARFLHDSGHTEDDQWILYHVPTAARVEALYWLEDQRAILTGEIRPASPAQRALIGELAGSTMPHRIAQQLTEMHARDEISAGAIGQPAVLRTLLDRLHMQEPLFFAAFQALLANHLIDLIGLQRQFTDEDFSLQNQIVKSSLSRDPFLQSRQDAATNIRNLLIRFHLISRIDQQRNATLKNPYAAFTELTREGDQIVLFADGTRVAVPAAEFVSAIRSIRRQLYRGERFESFNTQVPWMKNEIAHTFRVIKQRQATRRELSPSDDLYVLERAVGG